MIRYLKEKLVGAIGSVSGAASILGSWQVCHNICLGTAAVLGILGITVAGMPLLFLTKLAVPFWIAAFTLLIVTIMIYVKKRCVSNRLIIINSGLIIAGIPFEPLKRFSIIFWIIGGIIVVAGISLYIKDKVKHKK